MATQPLIALDPSWPKKTLAECEAALCAPGERFEMETVVINGVPTRVWKNAPPSLRLLLQFARSHGTRPASILDDERVSYEATYRAAATLAKAMADIGVVKGDRVAFATRNLPEWPVIFFACMASGVIAVPLNSWWTGGELEYGIADSGAKLLIVDGERYDRLKPHLPALSGLEQVWVTRARSDIGDARRLEDIIGTSDTWATLPEVPLPDVDILPDDDATIFYTSGTTGKPKGALGSHRNLATNIMSTGFSGARRMMRLGEPIPEPEPKTILTVIPLFHVTACSATLMGADRPWHRPRAPR